MIFNSVFVYNSILLLVAQISFLLQQQQQQWMMLLNYDNLPFSLDLQLAISKWQNELRSIAFIW